MRSSDIWEKSQSTELLGGAGNGALFLTTMAKRSKTPPSDVIKGQYHEAFCDLSYYHMWCVRRPNERQFGQGHHVHTKAEALSLMDRLDDLERKKQRH